MAIGLQKIFYDLIKYEKLNVYRGNWNEIRSNFSPMNSVQRNFTNTA